jgi:hypothetical protein
MPKSWRSYNVTRHTYYILYYMYICVCCTCICGMQLGASYDSFLDLNIFKCFSPYIIIFKTISRCFYHETVVNEKTVLSLRA